MNVDHIKYLKIAVEQKIRDRAGTEFPLAKKFMEIYPKPSEILKILPCAAVKYIPMGAPKFSGMWDRRTAAAPAFTKVRRIYDTKHVYQVDIFSKDIYDFYEKDGTYKGYLTQFIEFIGAARAILNPAGDGIGVECGVFGILDDEDLIVDGIYKAYCQVIFSDGIYRSETIPMITGINLEEGEIKNG